LRVMNNYERTARTVRGAPRKKLARPSRYGSLYLFAWQ
jgi:hypothetical protein